MEEGFIEKHKNELIAFSIALGIVLFFLVVWNVKMASMRPVNEVVVEKREEVVVSQVSVFNDSLSPMPVDEGIASNIKFIDALSTALFSGAMIIILVQVLRYVFRGFRRW